MDLEKIESLGFRGEALSVTAITASGRGSLPDGSARSQAERSCGCVRNAQYRGGSLERQTRIEQGPHQAPERPLSCFSGTVFLAAGPNPFWILRWQYSVKPLCKGAPSESRPRGWDRERPRQRNPSSSRPAFPGFNWERLDQRPRGVIG